MQIKRNQLTGSIAAVALATGSMAASAQSFDEMEFDPSLSAGFTVANMYLFRGADLNSGTPLVAGSIEADSGVGFYAGAWTAGGDSNTEIDLYGGYAFEVADALTLDFHVTNFIFPNRNPSDTAAGADSNNFGDFTEVGVTASAAGASFTYLNNVAGDAGYEYFNASYGYGPFSIALGHNKFRGAGDDTHLDLGFDFNENLSFTVSQLVDTPSGAKDSTNFLVSYSRSFSFQ